MITKANIHQLYKKNCSANKFESIAWVQGRLRMNRKFAYRDKNNTHTKFQLLSVPISLFNIILNWMILCKTNTRIPYIVLS